MLSQAILSIDLRERLLKMDDESLESSLSGPLPEVTSFPFPLPSAAADSEIFSKLESFATSLSLLFADILVLWDGEEGSGSFLIGGHDSVPGGFAFPLAISTSIVRISSHITSA